MNWIFFVLLPLLGGLIAYFADRLGRNLGKKRLSLFRMRPRHTAEFLTVCAGALIPLATVAIVMVASADVREWILRGPDLLRERSRAENELKNSQFQITVVERHLKDDQSLLDDANRKLRDTKKSIQALNVRVQTLDVNLKSETSKVGVAQSKLGLVQTRYDTANRRLENATRDYQRAQQNFSKVNQDLTKLQQNKTTLDQQYSALQVSYRTLNVQREEANKRVVEVNKQLDDLNKKLAQENTNLEQVRADYGTVSNELAMAKSNLDAANAQLKNDEITILSNRGLANITRLRPVLLGVGDELSRVRVPANTSEANAQRLLQQALDEADRYAISQGTKTRLTSIILNPGQEVTFEQQKASVLQALTGSSKDAVIVASSYWNTVQDQSDFAPIILHVAENPLIYHQNEKIAETTIEGSLPEDQIIQSISDFMQKDVRAKAKADKMIPVAGREEQFGSVSFREIYSLVRRIHDWGKPTRVIVYAAQDTRAADALNLKFQLR